MSDTRDFDVLVYGATGFAGKYVTEYLLCHAPTTRWAIAGRSRIKLDALLSRLRAKHRTVSRPAAVLVADALGDTCALRSALARTRVVINCAGPFARLGGPVVAAAVEAGAHYVDVTGEPVHVLRAMDEQHAAAAAAGVLVVPACGFDHIPTDFGGLSVVGSILRDRARDRGVADPRMAVEMFVRFHLGAGGHVVNTGTLDSIIEGVFRMRETEHLQRRVAARAPRVKPYDAGFGFGMGREPRLRGAPVVCANDGEAYAVARSLRLVDEGVGGKGLPGSDRFAFQAYFEMGTWSALVMLIVSFFVCVFVSVFPGGRRLVLKYPGLFTFGVFAAGGPTEEQVEKVRAEYTYFGRAKDAEGKDVAHVVVKAKSPEPGYDATSRMAIACAFTILEEREMLPKGGVLTPGVAFHASGLQQRLKDMGAMEFEVESP